MKKKLLLTLMCLVTMLSMTFVCHAAELTSFRDVPSSHWAYASIMDMAKRGVIAGTAAPDDNGVGTFSPNGTMKRSEFLTMLVRYFYADELNAMPEGYTWYANAFSITLDKGIVEPGEFVDLNVAMSRQEMALVLTRVAKLQNLTPEKLVDTAVIADWKSIPAAYQESVRTAYSLGLLTGTDSKGTFSPKGTLNRAAAATVLYRLIGLDEGTYTPVIPEPAPGITDDDYNTSWDGVGVYDDVELVPGDPFANMPNTKAIYDELGCTHDSPTGNSITINGMKLQLFEGEGFEIGGFTTAPDDDPNSLNSIQWRVQTAYIKDLLDKESADAVIKWLDEMARLCMISVDTGLEYGFGSPEDEAAYKIYSDYVTPAFEGETKIGNVIMYFNCTSTGAPMAIGFKNP